MKSLREIINEIKFIKKSPTNNEELAGFLTIYIEMSL